MDERTDAQYRAFIEEVLDRSDIGTIILNEDFEVVWISGAIERCFGLDREAVVGASKPRLVREVVGQRVDDTERFVERLLATYEDDADTERFECRIRSGPDRQERWVEHWSKPIESGLYAGGRIEHYTDITERKRQERELRRRNERLDEFASIVSHDLRNPLNVAEGRLELARAECDSDHLDAIGRAHDRMQALIDDLLTLARTGGAGLATEPVALDDVVEGCWRNVDTGTATLTTDVDLTLRAAPKRVKQLLENLFRNAVEHGGDDVTVAVGELSDAAGFYVADDGPGIPPAERDRVFEAGYSTSEDGTGLGLDIVAEIADAHGWAVDVTESERGGARFELTGVDVERS